MDNKDTNNCEEKKEMGILYDLKENNYIYEGIKGGLRHTLIPNFTTYPHDMFHQVLHFLFVGRMPLSASVVELFTGKKGYKWLYSLKPGDSLLLHDICNLRTLRVVADFTNPGVKRYLYFCNSLKFTIKPHLIANHIEKMKNMGYRIVTFDSQEARKYAITFAPQFYRFPIIKLSPILYDFFFCGLRKNRGERIDNLKLYLEKRGFRCLFISPLTPGAICYKQYLDYVEKSRCIVDITEEGQSGLTRRPMEALFFNKKLITSNFFIKEYDFYCKTNIFILDDDNLENLEEFMESDVKVISDSIKRKYDVNTWLENFK